MVTLLAFIGFIVVLWLIQKGLTKASTWFYTMSNECLDYITLMKRRQVEADRALQQRNKNAAEVLSSLIEAPEQDIKGEKPNELTSCHSRGDLFSFYKNIRSGTKASLLENENSEHELR